jgi:hypothetical protein
VSEVSEEECSGKMGRLKIKITNYKIQIKNKSQITMSKITNPMAAMHPCIHASMQSYDHAISFPFISFSHLPIFSASQLPSLPPVRRRQK